MQVGGWVEASLALPPNRPPLTIRKHSMLID